MLVERGYIKVNIDMSGHDVYGAKPESELGSRLAKDAMIPCLCLHDREAARLEPRAGNAGLSLIVNTQYGLLGMCSHEFICCRSRHYSHAFERRIACIDVCPHGHSIISISPGITSPPSILNLGKGFLLHS